MAAIECGRRNTRAGAVGGTRRRFQSRDIMNTKSLLQNFLRLQALEFDAVWDDDTEKQIAKLRAQIPPQMLGHYDRMSERGKKGVAAVCNQVCTGCHVRVPRATVIYLTRGEDIQICENCGVYLYLPELMETEPLTDRPAARPITKLPPRRQPIHAS